MPLKFFAHLIIATNLVSVHRTLGKGSSPLWLYLSMMNTAGPQKTGLNREVVLFSVDARKWSL